MIIRQIISIIIISVVFGLGVNLFSPNKIDYIGQYRDLHTGDGPIIPPSAYEGDPPFIAIDVAEMEYSLGKTIFIDARDNSEFVCGTIPGSINIPFDYLPEEDLEGYFDSALTGYDKSTNYIIFCSGEECDLSLMLARNMQDLGYENLAIFFGGSREWEKFDLELEKGDGCEE